MCVEHCKNFDEYHNIYISEKMEWNNISGIYKITYLPCHLFAYYGSSNNIGRRLKYHYYSAKHKKNFLGLFIKVFKWSSFSVTLIEKCSIQKLKCKEDWYLSKFKPLLNFMTSSYVDARNRNKVSLLTRKKN